MAEKNWKKYLNLLQRQHKFWIIVSCAVASGFFFVLGIYPRLGSVGALLSADAEQRGLLPFRESVIAEPLKPKHVETPEAVKAIYMTSWVAATPKWRAELVDFVKKTEINSIIIDVKDYTGMITFDTKNDIIKAEGSEEIRVKDMRDFIEVLHDAGIYTIARITVFQDPFYSKKHPDIAVQKKNGTLWKDRKGLSYIDPGAGQYWDYIVDVARATEAAGFDELNFDYIRFPSDGNMSDIVFPVSGVRAKNKPEVLNDFFAYLHKELREGENALPTPISADVFGMTTSNFDDLNIGQVLEPIAKYFDFVAPMVYPSHYPATFHGFKNPAEHPYEIVLFAMSEGVKRLQAPTSTPLKLRPWLQDFDLGADYGPVEVRAQIQATYDAGLTSWMIWDPSNKYTRGAYEIE